MLGRKPTLWTQPETEQETSREGAGTTRRLAYATLPR